MTTNNNVDNFFTSKHKQLERLATLANVFAWIVFVFYLLYTLNYLWGRWDYFYNVVAHQSIQVSEIINILWANPITYVRILLDTLNLFVHGVVYGLTLKGVSLGLNMIIETDMNYRAKYQGNNDE